MARPFRCRRIESLPVFRSFSPDDAVPAETVLMTVDEFETVRLIDGEGLNQEACASRMEVSRTTVTAVYDSARKKVARMLSEGCRLVISGGKYSAKPASVPEEIAKKGESVMRIAVTYENGEVFQHFGHSAQFKFYDVENGRIALERVADTDGAGHGALAGYLKAAGADVLLCGGIGPGARVALEEAGIKLVAGVSGNADEAARAFCDGSLKSDPDAGCAGGHHHAGHGHDGECGGHDGCGGHGC